MTVAPEQIVYGWLTASSGLASIVGTRIYPDVIPADESLPAIAFARIGSEPISTIHGSVLGDIVPVQIQGWAETRTKAEEVGDQIVVALAAQGEPYVARSVLFDEETGNFASAVDVRILVT